MMFKMYGIIWSQNYGLQAFIDNDTKYMDYKGIIELLHPNYKWTYEQDDDYQGDFYACGVNEKRSVWTFISGSFGSCSGCDWLQGLSGVEDAKQFLTHFKKVVIRKRSKESIIKYMQQTMINEYSGRATLAKLIKKSAGL